MDLFDDDEVDPEAPDESDMDSHDEPDLDVCPHCRKLILEDTERCPHCGEFISPEHASLPRPLWMIVVAIMMVALILIAWSHWQ
jgi:predicted amidophosphoribosyltransferase